MRQLRIFFQEPGLIEAIAIDPAMPKPSSGLNTPGYHSLWIADLMIDTDPRTDKPYTFMSSSFDKTYPLVIWALKIHMADETFDVPQAGLWAVRLDEAFSWAYTHFILEDEALDTEIQALPSSTSLTSQVLHHAAATVH